MVRHGTQKKRRSGVKVTRKLKKPASFKVAQKVVNPLFKLNYDKKKSPKENLQLMGLESDANNIVCSKPAPLINKNYKAFEGFADLLSDTIDSIPKVVKVKILDEFQLQNAKQCLDKYKLNFSKMAKDISVNYNQLTELKLKKLCMDYIRQTNQSESDYA